MGRLGIHRMARLGMIGIPVLGLACSQVPFAQRTMPSPMLLQPTSAVDPAMGFAQSLAEDSTATPDATVRASGAPTHTVVKQQLPISLDTVLRLAEEQNPQVGLARSKVCAAFAEKEAAAAKWLPDIYLGVGYYRHAGGIQLQEGPLVRSDTGALQTAGQLSMEYNPRDYAFRQIDAARKVCQSQGELSKISYEQLLDASTTYIDLLAAHAAYAISQDLEKKAREILVKVQKKYDMANGTADVAVERDRVSADVTLQEQSQTKLRGQMEAASAKLCYLLGLEPGTELVPVDTQMAAFHLVDASLPTDTLVGQALATGPGVRELESILGLIQSGLETAKGPARYVPVVSLQTGEGLFAAGPFGTLDWSNRWDMALTARWNISEVFTAKYKHKVAMAQMNQAQMTFQDLRAKLAMGVQEARSTIEWTAAQFHSSEALIKNGKETVGHVQKLADEHVQGATDSSVVTALKGAAMAQLNYVDQMREYDKAQLRLLVLLGGAAAPQPR